MPLTLGLTGMDPATETALKAAFAAANARLDGRWRLLPESGAEHVLVDMDSMYGPMSWLRLHAAGKRVVGLTTAPRTQTDFRLGRPFDSDSLVRLLAAIEQGSDAPLPELVDADIANSAAATTSEAPPELVETPASPPQSATPAPAPQDQLPEEIVHPVVATDVEPEIEVDPLPEAVTEPVIEPEPIPAHDPVFADWLQPDGLTQRVRYRRDSGPTLLIDPAARRYHGPATLKPIAGYFQGIVRREDFEPVDDDTWERESAAAGSAQSLSRLSWLGGLTAGHGVLLPGLDPEGRYQLNKWPQTEREYPRHFRIATAMMKGPATLAEIATASGVPAADVADFVNANLATGYAEHVPEPEPEPGAPAKPTGLFGRFRGR